MVIFLRCWDNQAYIFPLQPAQLRLSQARCRDKHYGGSALPRSYECYNNRGLCQHFFRHFVYIRITLFGGNETYALGSRAIRVALLSNLGATQKHIAGILHFGSEKIHISPILDACTLSQLICWDDEIASGYVCLRHRAVQRLDETRRERHALENLKSTSWKCVNKTVGGHEVSLIIELAYAVSLA